MFSATYIRDIPPQDTNQQQQPRTPFYTPPGTVEKNLNNNHHDPAQPPNPPPRTHHGPSISEGMTIFEDFRILFRSEAINIESSIRNRV